MKYLVIMLLILFACLLGGCKDNIRAKVRTEANKIHSQIKSEDFGRIYEEASPRIRECYSQDSFMEKMRSLVSDLKTVDSQLNFKQVNEETEKFEGISSSSDMFVDDVYTVGTGENELREYLVFKNEDNKLKLFAYRVFDKSQKNQNVSSTMIACSKGN